MTVGTPLIIDHIEAKPGSGAPRIAGTGILVSFIAGLVDYHKQTVEQICQAYELTPGQVYAALSYYADHKAEIEQAEAAQEKRIDDYFREHPEADEPRQRLIARSKRKLGSS